MVPAIILSCLVGLTFVCAAQLTGAALAERPGFHATVPAAPALAPAFGIAKLITWFGGPIL